MKNLLFLALLFLVSCESPLLDHAKTPFTTIAEQGNRGIGRGQWRPALSRAIGHIWIIGPYGDPSIESAIKIEVLDESGQLIDLPEGVDVRVFGWMPSMGHGTADDGYISHEESGRYINRDMYFSMPGVWDVHLIFERGSTLVDEMVFSIHL